MQLTFDQHTLKGLEELARMSAKDYKATTLSIYADGEGLNMQLWGRAVD